MARRYDWKRRTELLVEAAGEYAAHWVGTAGTTRAKISTVNRGERFYIEWRRNKTKQWTAVRVMSRHGRDIYVELKHGIVLTVADWTLHKGDWKKLYKQLERTIFKHLTTEHASQIMSNADDRYYWDCTCVKN